MTTRYTGSNQPRSRGWRVALQFIGICLAVLCCLCIGLELSPWHQGSVEADLIREPSVTSDSPTEISELAQSARVAVQDSSATTEEPSNESRAPAIEETRVSGIVMGTDAEYIGSMTVSASVTDSESRRSVWSGACQTDKDGSFILLVDGLEVGNCYDLSFAGQNELWSILPGYEQIVVGSEHSHDVVLVAARRSMHVRGVMVDSIGRGLEGGLVWAYGSKEVRTGPGGVFQFDAVVTADKVVLKFKGTESFCTPPATLKVAVSSEQQLAGVIEGVRLNWDGACERQVLVVDGESKAISGAVVTLDDCSWVSGSDGRCRVSALHGMERSIDVVCSGYARTTDLLPDCSSEELETTVRLVAYLPRRGQVVDDRSAGIPGVRVRWYLDPHPQAIAAGYAISDSGGFFNFGVPIGSNVILHGVAPDGRTATSSALDHGKPGATRLVLQDWGKLTGRVMDENDLVVRGVRVVANRIDRYEHQSPAAITNNYGEFSLKTSKNGQYRVSVFGPFRMNEEVVDFSGSNVTVRVSKPVALVKVRIADEHGAPIRQFEIRLTSESSGFTFPGGESWLAVVDGPEFVFNCGKQGPLGSKWVVEARAADAGHGKATVTAHHDSQRCASVVLTRR